MENEKLLMKKDVVEVIDSSLQVYPMMKDGKDPGLVVEISNTIKAESEEEDDKEIIFGLFLDDPSVFALSDALKTIPFESDDDEDDRIELKTEAGHKLFISDEYISISKASENADEIDMVTHVFKSPSIIIKMYFDGEEDDVEGVNGELLQFKANIRAYCELVPRKYMENELDMIRMESMMAEINDQPEVEEILE